MHMLICAHSHTICSLGMPHANACMKPPNEHTVKLVTRARKVALEMGVVRFVITDELVTAQAAGDSRSVLATHKILGLRDRYLKRPHQQHTVADPEAEREAWKTHFQQLQAGREQAAPHVWANVAQGHAAGDWLGAPPTEEELMAYGKQMKNGKGAGSDGF